MRSFKSKILIKISNFRKDDNKLIKVEDFYETIKGKDLQNALSSKHPIEMVDKQPDKFVFGVVYILKTGNRAWIFNQVD